MTKEFKKISHKTETRYVLENSSAGATSAAATASNGLTPTESLGMLQRRLQELKDKIPVSKPRNPIGMGSTPGRGTQKHQSNQRQQDRDQKKIHTSESLDSDLDYDIKQKIIRFLVNKGAGEHSDLELLSKDELFALYQENKGPRFIIKIVGKDQESPSIYGIYNANDKRHAQNIALQKFKGTTISKEIVVDTQPSSPYASAHKGRSVPPLSPVGKGPSADELEKGVDGLIKKLQNREPIKGPFDLEEFAPNRGDDGKDLKTLAAEWMHSDSPEEIESILARGVMCPDGQIRKLYIDYNQNYDGVVINANDGRWQIEYKESDLLGLKEEGDDQPDHEISMASNELQSIAADAANLLNMVRQRSEEEGLEAWQQSKITKAADYMNSVLQSIRGDIEQGVAEAAKWRTTPGAHKEPNDDVYDLDYDMGPSIVPNVPDRGTGEDPLNIRPRFSHELAGDDAKRKAKLARDLKFNIKKSQGIHGPAGHLPEDVVDEQGVAEAKSPEEFINQLKSLDHKQPRVTHTCKKCGKKWQLQHHCKGAPEKKQQNVTEGSEQDDPFRGATPPQGKTAARNAHRLGKTYANPHSPKYHKKDHAAWDRDYNSEMTRLKNKGVAETFNKPYKVKSKKKDFGEIEMSTQLPDGSDLNIVFAQYVNRNNEKVAEVDFYRDETQEVTGEGDAQRIFATVINAITRFVKQHKPQILKFSASVFPGAYDNQSRVNLYNRLVQRYAVPLGYDVSIKGQGDVVEYFLSRKEGVAEGSLNEFAVDGFGDSGDKRSKLLASVGRLLDSGNKVDWQVPGQMGHVTQVKPDGITMKKWKQPHSRMSFFLPMYDDSRDNKYTIKMVAPKHYAVVSAEQGVAEGSEQDDHDYDDGEDRLSGRHGLSADPKKMAVYYPNDPERTKIRTQMNVPNLKKAIKSNLGKHKKPNLPEQGVAEDKIKGVDGKACWKGKRYAGRKKKADGTYKDICIPVGEDAYFDKLNSMLNNEVK